MSASFTSRSASETIDIGSHVNSLVRIMVRVGVAGIGAIVTGTIVISLGDHVGSYLQVLFNSQQTWLFSPELL